MSDNTVAVLDSVSRFLDRQHGLYIDGQWRASAAEGRLAVYNPANGQQIATTADANEHDVALAVQSAHKAFSEGVWAQRLPVERERILLRFADLVEQHAEELAQLETLEQGKSINIARAFEVGSTLNWMRYTAGLATKITGQTLDVSIPMPPGAKYQVYTRKEPIGVVAGIVPWNFPLMIGMWKVMPALAAGCSIVIKPSETTPLTLLRIAELASEAGVPPGVFNVVTGRGTVCGKALTEHPLIAKVSFTGSTPVGKSIARSAADRLTRVTLELGGKNPAIVLKDADPQQVIEGLMLPTLDLGPAHAQHQWRLTGPQGERVEWEHTPRLVTDDMLMLRTAAIAGAGIVQLPAMMMRDDMLRGELVQLLPGWQPQGGVVHAVYPSRRGLLPAVRLLLDYLGEQFASIEEE